MATLHAPTSPVARCSKCGVQLQFHAKSDVPHSADRDHEFVAETIDDFEPGDLTPAQLVDAIIASAERSARLIAPEHVPDADWDESSRLEKRADACRVELRARVRTVFGVTWDDLVGAVE